MKLTTQEKPNGEIIYTQEIAITPSVGKRIGKFLKENKDIIGFESKSGRSRSDGQKFVILTYNSDKNIFKV